MKSEKFTAYCFYCIFASILFLTFKSEFVSGEKITGCSIQILVDPYLQDHLRETFTREKRTSLDVRREITFFVGQHLRFVNSVLEKYNFLPTGDPIRLFLKKIKILDFSNCVHQGVDYCKASPDELLSLHSSVNQNEFCLSFIFTYRDLKDGFLGMAWTASSKQADEGGVCSRFTEKSGVVNSDLEDNEGGWEIEDLGTQIETVNGTSQSRNTGLVSFKYNSGRVPDFVSKLAFLHEIGHSLGSPHDFPQNCQHSETGYFVMHPRGGLNGFLDNNYQFSECSIKNISITMASLETFDRNCLLQVPASICGNGLVEAWEECDCGANDEECQPDKCCYPSNHPEFGCQRKQKAHCSPSEGGCCTDDCKLVPKSAELECAQESECNYEAFCDGTQSACPIQNPKSNSNTCRQGTMICLGGECSQSICSRFNMIPCRATQDYPCEIHCQTPRRPETCSPTSKQSPLFSQPVHQPINTFCHISDDAANVTILGYCSSENQCQAYVEKSGVTNTSWIIGLIIFLVCYSIMMAVGFWLYCRYCRNTGKNSHNVLHQSDS